MSYRLLVIDQVGGTITRQKQAKLPTFVEAYDPEAFDGRGFVDFTDDPARAIHFATQAEAIEFWRQVPKSRPVREDGRPNRPLMAFSVEVQPVA